MGRCCILIGANGLGNSTLLHILGGRHLTTPDSDVRVLCLNSFRDTKLNFHRAYIYTNWGMRTVAFAGVGIPLMADIPGYGMMEKLQNYCPGRRDELVEMLGIYLNWIMHKLGDVQRRQTCAYSYWSDTKIQGEFIRRDNDVPRRMCETRHTAVAHQIVK